MTTTDRQQQTTGPARAGQLYCVFLHVNLHCIALVEPFYSRQEKDPVTDRHDTPGVYFL